MHANLKLLVLAVVAATDLIALALVTRRLRAQGRRALLPVLWLACVLGLVAVAAVLLFVVPSAPA